ncbi:hypothetical protein, partial [Novipirellula maiorica]|uniref:hypothetical protein n=1 Tax=Novipirellula maiorica TaxID=1265734 RepID=UPI00059301AE
IYFRSGTRQSSWFFNSKDGNSGESHYLSIPQWLPKLMALGSRPWLHRVVPSGLTTAMDRGDGL